MYIGFGALGGGVVMLYQKSETDKKEIDQKLDKVLSALETKH
jgi:hypothetical protein